MSWEKCTWHSKKKKKSAIEGKNILYDLILLLKLNKLSKISSSLQ